MVIRIAILFLLLSAGCASAQQRVLHLAVSIAPQRYLLQQLVGADVSIDVLVRNGQNPATWEITPRQMMALAQTDALFRIGVPFERIYLPKLRRNFPALKIYAVHSGIKRYPFAAAEHATADNIDPHIWLDPLLDIRMAENMAAALTELDPDNSAIYQRRLKQVRREFEQLHRRIATLLEQHRDECFMVFHPSWGYFARRYHLCQLAIELHGRQPRGAALARIIDSARAHHIGTIFVQSQFSRKTAAAVAAQLGIKVETLDPLPQNLAAGLLETAQKLSHALEQQCQPSSH